MSKLAEFMYSLKERYRNVEKRYMRIDEFKRNIGLTILIAVFGLFIGLFVIFSIIRLMPGDPVAAYLAAKGIHIPTDQQYQQATRELGLDNFFVFVGAFFTGNWRISLYLKQGTPVIYLIGEKVLEMLALIALPLIIGVSLGIFLGKVSSRDKGSRKNKIIQLFGIFGVSIPMFFFGLSFQYLFCHESGICDSTGFSFLPIVILTLSITSLIIWQTRYFMIKKPHQTSLISNSLRSGSIFGFIFMFYTLIERTFEINGLGNYLTYLFGLYEFFLLAGCLYAILIMFILMTLISNLIFCFKRNSENENHEENLEFKPSVNKNKGIKHIKGKFYEDIKEYLLGKMKSPIFILGVISVAFFVIISIFPLLIATQSYDFAILPHPGTLNPPSSDHPLGQTIMGGDVLSRTIWGIRDALFFSILAVTISIIIGGFIGYIAGIFHSLGKKIIMGLMIFFYILPGLILSLFFLAIYGPFVSVGLPCIVILLIPNFTRTIAHAIPGEINFKRIAKTIIAQIPINIAIAILFYTSIDFLGFFNDVGIRLANDINVAVEYLPTAPWASLWPGLAIFGLIFSFLLLHIGLEDSEPDLREVKALELK